jgi:hypothetical protein
MFLICLHSTLKGLFPIVSTYQIIIKLNIYVMTLPFVMQFILTLNLLKTTIVALPSNASKWQMGFNSAFKGLM